MSLLFLQCILLPTPIIYFCKQLLVSHSTYGYKAEACLSALHSGSVPIIPKFVVI